MPSLRHPQIKKDPAACAIFGAIALRSGRGAVYAQQARDAIAEVQWDRGGGMGNGILLSHPSHQQNGDGHYHMEILATDRETFEKGAMLLDTYGDVQRVGEWKALHGGEGRGIWSAPFISDDLRVTRAVVELNGQFSPAELRIISSGKHQLLIKDLDPLTDLVDRYGLDEVSARAVLAHTRYPTGAGPLASRAHPHTFGDIGMVFNGDVKSYIGNRRRAEAILAEGLYPLFEGDEALEDFIPILRRSWVGSDAEVIAAPFYFLLKSGLSIPSVVSTLVPPFDNYMATLDRSGFERDKLRRMLTDYSGMQLDGPVAVIVLVTTDDDVQLLAFRDRNEFRPLRIMYDRENGMVYAGSEDRQLERASGRRITDTRIESYALDSGQFLWVSSNEGVLESGRTRRPMTVTLHSPKPNGKTVVETRGEPHLFAGDITNEHRTISGLAGNCTGAYTMGGVYEILGSVQANAFESSRAEGIIVHRHVDMMFANAFQGGFAYVRGSGDSRCFQQLRHSQQDKPPPVAIVGERIGTYGFKMIAGGVGVVAGIGEIGHEEEMQPLVGRFLATGMMSGTVYVRGKVPREYIGRPPSARRMMAIRKELVREGVITREQEQALYDRLLDLPYMEEVLGGNTEAIGRLAQAFYPPHQKPFVVEYRLLNEDDRAIMDPHFARFGEIFELDETVLEALKTSPYTVVRLKE